MVLSAKSTPDGWSGFLLIFFPPPAPSPPFSGRLLSKTLSTLSICSLLLLATFLLFTLSTFEPSSALRHHSPRRLLLFRPRTVQEAAVKQNSDTASLKALQGMGILYRRGTRAMPDLIVAHVSHAVDETGFRTFLRILHASGLLARSDLAFIFSSPSISSKLSPLIREESDSFLKLVSRYDVFNRTTQNSCGLAGLARYLRTKKDEKKEPKEAIWGKGFRPTNRSDLDESNRPSYGSIVGFDSSELDSENSLSGFLDHVPMDLRRWACYPMLLGRLKRSYKHVLLADAERVVLVNDPFSRVRNHSPESVYFWAYPEAKRGKRLSPKAPQQQEPTLIIPGIVAGGSRGVRRLSDAVLTEIVRFAMENKKKAGKSAFTESGVMNRLLRGGHLLKNVNVIDSTEPAPDTESVSGSGGSVWTSAVVVQSGRGVSILRDLLWCWSDLHTTVYNDCLDTQINRFDQ